MILYVRGSSLLNSGLAKTLVMVEEYHNSVFSGIITHPLTKANYRFSGVTDFLLKIEGIYNKCKFPQATHSERSFFPKNQKIKELFPETEVKLEVDGNNDNVKKINGGHKATFIIKILYRQNATWQGNIQWLEENKSQNFRSDLEMLKLIDEALKITDGNSYQTPTWE
jgi:hypothetical protein